MEEKRTLLDYLAQVLTIFGFAMAVMNFFCLILGDTAVGVSALFALGSRGLPAEICFQFLGVSALLVGARFLFFTDVLIRKMPIWLRTVCLLTVVVAVIAAFVAVFGWFPVDKWQPWAMFFVCFGISFAGSYFVMAVKEKGENRRMEEALQRLKEEGGKTQ